MLFHALPDGPQPDASIININVRLYAKTEIGLLAIDPEPQTYGAGIPHDALRTGEPQAMWAPGNVPDFLQPHLDEGRAQGPWQGVIQELKEWFGIETDPETLKALPFELVGDQELREALSAR